MNNGLNAQEKERMIEIMGDFLEYRRTDLALEEKESKEEQCASLPEGVQFFTRRQEQVEIAELKVETEEAAKLLGKPAGRYVTLSFDKPWLMSDEEKERLAVATGQELKKLIEDMHIPGEGCVLVVGLGNRRMTADGIGPAVESKILVTRHIHKLDPPLFRSLSHKEVAAMAPGVLGDTGMESAETVEAVAKSISPALLIVVDALAAGSTKRLATTVQLCNTGISPGAGVGNDRPAFTKERFGVPVIGIGVPMVVDSVTLVADTLEKAGITRPEPALEKVLEEERGFFVSPKEADAALEALSDILARAIDQALGE